MGVVVSRLLLLVFSSLLPFHTGTSHQLTHLTQILPNVKPWLLNVHPHHPHVESTQAFVLAAPDAPSDDPRRSSPNGSAKSLLWSSGVGEHGLGSYLDFSSEGALRWWKERIKDDLVGMGISGVW